MINAISINSKVPVNVENIDEGIFNEKEETEKERRKGTI